MQCYHFGMHFSAKWHQVFLGLFSCPFITHHNGEIGISLQVSCNSLINLIWVGYRSSELTSHFWTNWLPKPIAKPSILKKSKTRSHPWFRKFILKICYGWMKKAAVEPKNLSVSFIAMFYGHDCKSACCTLVIFM